MEIRTKIRLRGAALIGEEQGSPESIPYIQAEILTTEMKPTFGGIVQIPIPPQHRSILQYIGETGTLVLLFNDLPVSPEHHQGVPLTPAVSSKINEL